MHKAQKFMCLYVEIFYACLLDFDNSVINLIFNLKPPSSILFFIMTFCLQIQIVHHYQISLEKLSSLFFSFLLTLFIPFIFFSFFYLENFINHLKSFKAHFQCEGVIQFGLLPKKYFRPKRDVNGYKFFMKDRLNMAFLHIKFKSIHVNKSQLYLKIIINQENHKVNIRGKKKGIGS